MKDNIEQEKFQYFEYEEAIKIPDSERELNLKFYEILREIKVGEHAIEAIYATPLGPEKQSVLMTIRYNTPDKCVSFLEDFHRKFINEFKRGAKTVARDCQSFYIPFNFYEKWL